MFLTINGTRKEFEQPLDIAAMLKAEGFEGMAVAVARNGSFVPRGQHNATSLEPGDDIEIVAPMQGG